MPEHEYHTHRRSVDPEDVFLYLIALFLPPLPVFIRCGLWTNQFLLNVLLTLMFGLPGTLHSIYIVYTTSSVTGDANRRVAYDDYERLVEEERRTDIVPETTPTPTQEHTEGSSAANSDFPPPYTTSDIHQATDNKVQLP